MAHGPKWGKNGEKNKKNDPKSYFFTIVFAISGRGKERTVPVSVPGKTVLAVPVPLSVSGKTVPTVPAPAVPVRFPDSEPPCIILRRSLKSLSYGWLPAERNCGDKFLWLRKNAFFLRFLGPSGKGRKRQKKGEKGRFRPISGKGGQTPLKPPFVTPPLNFAAAQKMVWRTWKRIRNVSEKN